MPVPTSSLPSTSSSPPLAALLLVMELTHSGFHLVVPMMAATVIATTVTRYIDGAPVKVTDRNAAEKLTNTKLFVDRSALPPADDDEYYLTDLIGLAVTDPAGAVIGTVSIVHDYGAGASLEIERKSGASLIVPFTAACVPTVDIAAGRVVVLVPDEIVVAQGVLPF